MPLISKEELEEMYWGEPGTEMGGILISRELECSLKTVYEMLKEYDIEVRPPSTESNECFTKKSRENISKEKNGNSDIDEEEAKKIYFDYKSGMKLKEIEEKYKRSSRLIMEITKGRHWYTEELSALSHSPGKKGYDNNKAKITKKQGLKIYKDYKESSTTKEELSEKYNISIAVVGRILKGDHWTTKGKQNISREVSGDLGLKIYEEYFNSDITQKELADKYNFCRLTIRKIVNCDHQTTKHLERKKKKRSYNNSGSKNPLSKVNKTSGINIYKDYQKHKNITQKELGNKYNISASVVNEIVNCKHWTTRHLKEGDK